MPYIGNDLATQFQAFATQTITGDGSTGYTLDRAVANGKELLVYINNVKQEEGSGKAYTASGTTITFSEAVASGDSCYVVFLGSAVQTVVPPDASIVSSMFSTADLSLTGALTITLDDNTDNLTLTSTDADANAGPNLRMYRNSASPADVDRLGHITFDGRNDNSQDFTAAQIQVFTEDASDGTEDSSVTFTCINGGSANNAIQINPTETTFNESSVDRDFRVESNGNANAFVVNGGTNRIGMGTNSPQGSLHIKDFVDSDGSDVTLVLQNGTANRQSAYQIMDEGGTVAAKLQYDNGGNTVSLGGVNNTSVTILQNNGAAISIDTSKNVTIAGSLSKGSGSFKIDHPLDSKKDTHHLVHSFIEGPQADLIYRGKVTLSSGTATVNIDTVSGMTSGTFVALNTNVQCFTNNESGWTAVKGSVSGNTLTITAQDNSCTDTISWMVIGERQDPHMKATNWTDSDGKVIVEPKKEEPKKEEEGK